VAGGRCAVEPWRCGCCGCRVCCGWRVAAGARTVPAGSKTELQMTKGWSVPQQRRLARVIDAMGFDGRNPGPIGLVRFFEVATSATMNRYRQVFALSLSGLSTGELAERFGYTAAYVLNTSEVKALPTESTVLLSDRLVQINGSPDLYAERAVVRNRRISLSLADVGDNGPERPGVFSETVQLCAAGILEHTPFGVYGVRLMAASGSDAIREAISVVSALDLEDAVVSASASLRKSHPTETVLTAEAYESGWSHPFDGMMILALTQRSRLDLGEYVKTLNLPQPQPLT
jgi:hypothetical protein